MGDLVSEYRFAIPFLVFSISILTYVFLNAFNRAVIRYKNIYIESVAMSLRDLFVLFNSEDIFAIGIVLGAGAGFLSFVLFGYSLTIAVIVAVAFFSLPRLYLRWARQKRIELFCEQLVDGLSLVSNSLRAGQSLPQAFGLMTKEMPAPISQEFGIVLKEYDLGVPIERCLVNMSDRVKSSELELFVSSILICSRTGGNLTETFDNISAMIRERVRLEGKIQSMTAEGRAQGLVLTLMPVLLGLAFFWIDPAMVRLLFDTTIGKGILFFVIALDVAAWFITRTIMDIDI